MKIITKNCDILTQNIVYFHFPPVCAFIMTFCLTERTAEDPEIPHEKLPRLSLDEDMPPLAISVEQLTAEDLREARLSSENIAQGKGEPLSQDTRV
jgi:hypothetical protein